MRKDCPDRFRAVIAIFWEAERLFELIHAFGGRNRVTMARLVRSLTTTSVLGGEIKADTRSGRYVATSWCHRAVLATLFDKEPAASYDPRHPHRAWDPGANPLIADELEGCVTDAARGAAVFNVQSAPPFAHHQSRSDQSSLAVTCWRPWSARPATIVINSSAAIRRRWAIPSRSHRRKPDLRRCGVRGRPRKVAPRRSSGVLPDNWLLRAPRRGEKGHRNRLSASL